MLLQCDIKTSAAGGVREGVEQGEGGRTRALPRVAEPSAKLIEKVSSLAANGFAVRPAFGKAEGARTLASGDYRAHSPTPKQGRPLGG